MLAFLSKKEFIRRLVKPISRGIHSVDEFTVGVMLVRLIFIYALLRGDHDPGHVLSEIEVLLLLDEKQMLGPVGRSL